MIGNVALPHSQAQTASAFLITRNVQMPAVTNSYVAVVVVYLLHCACCVYSYVQLHFFGVCSNYISSITGCLQTNVFSVYLTCQASPGFTLFSLSLCLRCSQPLPATLSDELCCRPALGVCATVFWVSECGNTEKAAKSGFVRITAAE